VPSVQASRKHHVGLDTTGGFHAFDTNQFVDGKFEFQTSSPRRGHEARPLRRAAQAIVDKGR